MEPTLLTQITQVLASVAAAAVTAFLGWAFTALQAKFGIQAADSAETAVRTAAATEAGKIAATVPPSITTSSTAPAAIVPPSTLQAAANKVIADLPTEVKLTGYTPADIGDMILAYLPGLLGAVNPALGAVAGVAAGIVHSAIDHHGV
jgi:hypothetical protein